MTYNRLFGKHTKYPPNQGRSSNYSEFRRMSTLFRALLPEITDKLEGYVLYAHNLQMQDNKRTLLFLEGMHDVQLQNHRKIVQQLDAVEYWASVSPSEFVFLAIDLESLKSFIDDVYK